MHYETPILEAPVDLYETPLLVDLDEATAFDIGDIGCATGGSCAAAT